jgi:sulfonate transport system permease protein
MSAPGIELPASARHPVVSALFRPTRTASGEPRQAKARPARASHLFHLLQFLALPALVLATWSILSGRGSISNRILPAPHEVARTFWDLVMSGELASHLGISLWRVARGAALGLSIGLGLGLTLGFSPAVETWIGPSFRMLAQVPSIALVPLLMMVLGIDDKLKLFIMAKACVIPVALLTADGIRDIPRGYLEVGAVFRLTRLTLVRRIVLPAALPQIFTGVRQGIAQVWVSLVAVEVLASAEGLGYLMTWGRLIFQLDVVLVCVAVIGAVGLVLDLGLRHLESRLLRWRGSLP